MHLVDKRAHARNCFEVGISRGKPEFASKKVRNLKLGEAANRIDPATVSEAIHVIDDATLRLFCASMSESTLKFVFNRIEKKDRLKRAFEGMDAKTLGFAIKNLDREHLRIVLGVIDEPTFRIAFERTKRLDPPTFAEVKRIRTPAPSPDKQEAAMKSKLHKMLMKVAVGNDKSVDFDRFHFDANQQSVTFKARIHHKQVVSTGNFIPDFQVFSVTADVEATVKLEQPQDSEICIEFKGGALAMVTEPKICISFAELAAIMLAGA